ncbi:hypothetical protein DPMN_187190 [Dreissena polymorpha]|uniref:Uncharacterized protein n=1 Tax=Dreissena polymorpha TaxID=45954 RepID=A0A9D4DRN1_DREPO|nr:hypothetical protein DPMN_187190 [Dreissena polymorpha]
MLMLILMVVLTVMMVILLLIMMIMTVVMLMTILMVRKIMMIVMIMVVERTKRHLSCLVAQLVEIIDAKFSWEAYENIKIVNASKSVSSMANMIGKIYFNFLGSKCFTFSEEEVCVERSWWGRCLRYEAQQTALLESQVVYNEEHALENVAIANERRRKQEVGRAVYERSQIHNLT